MTNEELVLQYRSIEDPRERQRIIEQIYIQNKGLISKVASKYRVLDSIEDLTQEAYFGLLRAVELWAPDGGASFSSFAFQWIRQSMNLYLINYQQSIRIPKYIYEELASLKKFREAFERRHGRQPSTKETIEGMGISAEKLSTLSKAAASRNPASLNCPLSDSEDLTLEDSISASDDPIEQVIDDLDRDRLAKDVNNAINQLPNREQKVIRARYFDDRTYKACAEEIGVSQTRAQQLEKEALKHLRSSKYSKQLRQHVADVASSYGYHRSGLTSFQNSGMSSVEAAAFRIDEIVSKYLEDGRL